MMHTTTSPFESTLAFAKSMDAQDPLRPYREQFHLPVKADGTPAVYLCGNSLGLQPKATAAAIQQELLDWQKLGVEGHFHAQNPWMPYHHQLRKAMASVVGALPSEVVVMNTLSVNLHLMMVSFYRPTATRFKILIEADAFPSDRYATASQIAFHGFDPKEGLLELRPRQGESTLRPEDIQSYIETQGQEIALIMLGNTNYYTGQRFDMQQIAAWGHAQGCVVGFDCAHGVGNVPLDLHEANVDFAVWCTYKYLNAGPGSIGGCFVHERHGHPTDLPRFTGWWGHKESTRFKMRDDFEAMEGADAWQLSNPPILSMAAVWVSLKMFHEVGMPVLRKKSLLLTAYMEFLLKALQHPAIAIITPEDPNQRGAQLSIQVKAADKQLFNAITELGVIADWREPDVIRVAPVPMYNSFEDVFAFVQILKKCLTI